MFNRIATTLLCTMAPVALLAQEVELRSPDEFISVEGEIVGFNGVMVRVQTTVGEVSVPASEVICYGTGCAEVLASNDFGLSSDDFQGVFEQLETVSATTASELTISFDAPLYGTLYRTAAGAFAVASQTSAQVELEANGDLRVQSADGNQSTTLTVAGTGAEADLQIAGFSLNGTAPAQYANPAAWAVGSRLSHQLVGLKSFSVVVAPNAEISEISVNDLARIYAGEITNWSQIGGADVNILPLQMPTNSLIGTEVTRLLIAPAGKEIAGNVLTMSDEAGIVASINQFPGSISVVSTANANPDLVVPVAGPCGIAVAPTDFNIVSGDYPLARPVMVSYGQTPDAPLLIELFDFASSDVAQGLLDREGFINYTAVALDSEIKNARLSSLLDASLDDAQRAAAAEMFQALFNAERLSPTMIGGETSGPEGAWNRAMMIDLAQVVSDPANAGREIAFVGLGQSTAGSDAAVAASAAAAAEIQALFGRFAASEIAEGGVTLTSYGFGNVSPTTCIDGQVAGSEYTRVEAWIR